MSKQQEDQQRQLRLSGMTVHVFKGQQYLNFTEAAKYVGYTYRGLKNKINAAALLHQQDENVPVVRRLQGKGKSVLINIADLDVLFAPHELSDDDLLDKEK